MSAAERFVMREPCAKCGETGGRIEERGAQDVVRCAACNAYAYCAPRTETGKAVRSVSTTRNSIKPKQRARLIMRAGARCELCGKRPGDTGALHLAHILSVKDALELAEMDPPLVLSDHEINHDENLIVSCDECNLGLGEQTMPLRVAYAVVRARVATVDRARRDAAERRRRR